MKGHSTPHTRGNALATLAYRGLVIVLSALAAVGQIAYLDVLYWDTLGLGRLAQGGIHPALFSSVVTGVVITAVASAAALTLVFKGDGDRGARPLGLALSAWGYLLAYSGLTVLLAPDGNSPLRTPFDIHFLLVEALGSAALLRFTAVFPAPLTVADLSPAQELPVGLRAVQLFRGWLLTPAAPWIAAVLATGVVVTVNAAMGRPVEDAALLLLTDVLRLGTLALVILNMRRAFVVGDTQRRRAMFWFVVGFTILLGAVGVLLGGNILTAVTGWEIPGFNWRPVVLDTGVLGLIWGAAMGVFYQGPMKPGNVSRKLAVAATAVTLGLFLSAGLESLMAGVIATRVTLPRGIGTVVALVAVGILYARTRRPIESMIYHAWAPAGDRQES